MSRADEYRAYLASAEWAALRAVVLERAGGRCEMCGAPARHVHHVRYPKQFPDDHPDNLVVQCERCHDLSHGIRSDTVNLPATLESYETITFEFSWNGLGINFDFRLIEGQLVIPVKVIGARLFRELSSDNPRWSGLDPRGHALEAQAMTFLSKKYRMKLPNGDVWVTASGAIQLLARSDSPVGQAFREQLGDWMEAGFLEGRNKLQAAAQSGSVAGGMLDVVEAMVKSLREQQQAVAVIDQKSTTALQIGQANTQAVEEIRETLQHGYQLTSEYLAARGLREPTSADFGRLMGKRIKDAGGRKDMARKGHFTRDGIRMSHIVDAADTRFPTLCKWRVSFMDECLRSLNQ